MRRPKIAITLLLLVGVLQTAAPAGATGRPTPSVNRSAAPVTSAYPPAGEYFIQINDYFEPDLIADGETSAIGGPVVLTLSNQQYSVAFATAQSRQAMDDQCANPVPAGTVIATFTPTGANSWLGKIALWKIGTCKRIAWEPTVGTTVTPRGKGLVITFIDIQSGENVNLETCAYAGGC